MIDLGRLRALDALARYGTVLAAGDALHCTPSAVSQQLSKLERETDTTLVEKDGRRLRLTEAGRLLADHADRVLAALDEAEAALAAHRDTVSGGSPSPRSPPPAARCCRTPCTGWPPTIRSWPPASSETNPHEGLEALPRARRPRRPRRLARGRAALARPGIARPSSASTSPTCSCPRTTGSPRPPVRLRAGPDERWIASPAGRPSATTGWSGSCPASSRTSSSASSRPRSPSSRPASASPCCRAWPGPALPDGVPWCPSSRPTRRVQVAWRASRRPDRRSTRPSRRSRTAWASRGDV